MSLCIFIYFLLALFIFLLHHYRPYPLSFPTRRSSDLNFLDESPERKTSFIEISRGGKLPYKTGSPAISVRSEERFSRNAETELVCRRLLEKKKTNDGIVGAYGRGDGARRRTECNEPVHAR